MVLPAWRPNKISSGEHTVNSAVSSTRPIPRGEPVLLGDAHFPWWHFPSLRETGRLQNLLLWASKPGGTWGKVCGELFEEDMHWKTINSCRLSRGQVGDRIPVSHTFGVSLTGVGHDWATLLSLFTFMHWRRKWQPTPVFLPGESQGRGSLVGCHLWGRAESDTTEATSQQQQQCYIATQLSLWKCPDACGVSVAALWRWQLFWFPLSVANPWHGRLSPGHCRPHPGSAFLQEAKWV